MPEANRMIRPGLFDRSATSLSASRRLGVVLLVQHDAETNPEVVLPFAVEMRGHIVGLNSANVDTVSGANVDPTAKHSSKSSRTVAHTRPAEAAIRKASHHVSERLNFCLSRVVLDLKAANQSVQIHIDKVKVFAMPRVVTLDADVTGQVTGALDKKTVESLTVSTAIVDPAE